MLVGDYAGIPVRNENDMFIEVQYEVHAEHLYYPTRYNHYWTKFLPLIWILFVSKVISGFQLYSNINILNIEIIF